MKMSDIQVLKRFLKIKERELKKWEKKLKKSPYNVLAIDNVYRLTGQVYEVKVQIDKIGAIVPTSERRHDGR